MATSPARWSGQLATASCPTTNAIPFALIVDNPDFTLTSTTGPISVVPGTVPSGNGLPTAPNQSSANPQSAILTIGGILSFAGQVSTTCVTQHPTWVFCSVGQLVVVNGATQPVNPTTLPYTAPGGTTHRDGGSCLQRLDIRNRATRLQYNGPTADLRYQDRVGVPAVWRPRFLHAPPAQTEQGVVDADCHCCSERWNERMRRQLGGLLHPDSHRPANRNRQRLIHV